MNIYRRARRLTGAMLAAATLSSSLAACATNSNEGVKKLTVNDLESLSPGEFANSYDKRKQIGNCELVTYHFATDKPGGLYEFVLYGPQNELIERSRGATAEKIEGIMNDPPSICR